MSCSWLRSLLSSLVASSALLSIATAEEGSTKSPFAGLNDSPFQAQTESAEATGKLVDLTQETVEPISLSDGAKLIDTALVRDNGRLLGLFGRSDQAFRDFISPASNVLFFEDPRTLTELRVHFVNQWIPGNNAVFQGGNAQFLAAQVRVALTQRLSIIATKDGYIWLNPGNAGLADSEGAADVAAGLKYNLIRNPDSQTIVSLGGTVELDTGAHRVFQGSGNGEFHLFSTAGQEFFGGLAHWNMAGGLRLPSDTTARSMMAYSSNQWDVKLTDRLYFLTGINWFHWLKSGNNLPVNFEGMDLFNLGASDVAGNDIVTSSMGLRYRFGRMNEAGICWELPLTERRDLLESRLYTDLCIRF